LEYCFYFFTAGTFFLKLTVMKGKIFAVLLIASVHVAQANVLTVSNDPNKPAQYTTIAAAFAAAAAGDTIYVYGSTANYGDLTINKSITIIGNGFNARKEFFHHSRMNMIRLNNDVSNVTIDGITFARFVAFTTAAFNYSNITLRNCQLGNDIDLKLNGGDVINCNGVLNNWLIENCIIYSFSLHYNTACTGVQPATTGFLVKNSLIYFFSDNYNVNFVNCQLGSINSQNTPTFNAVRDCSFDNCMFIKYQFAQNSTNTGNVFNNCLTYQITSPNFDLQSWTGGANGTANNCIINQNPLWVNSFALDGIFNMLSNPLIPSSWDPALNAGSPALNNGIGGTNIGLTGGVTPYRYRGEPNLPVVRRFQLINNIVPPNGTVNLNATATKPE
jgi:hypothetical protein